MTIDDYIAQRNEIYFDALSKYEQFGELVWSELGVANRHIERVVKGTFQLHMVEREIVACLERV